MAAVEVEVDVDAVRHNLNKHRRSHMAPPVAHAGSLQADARTATRKLATGSATADAYASPQASMNVGSFFVGDGTVAETTRRANALVDAWYDASADYDYVNPPGPRPDRTHVFTRMVWADSRQFGVAVSKTPDTDKMWLALTFWPRGNRPGRYASNVAPPGLADIERLGDFYSKAESDARYLHDTNLGDFLADARQGGVDAAEANHLATQELLRTSYYTKGEVDQKLDVDIADDLQALSARLTQDYYERSVLDTKESAVRSELGGDIDALRAEVQASITAVDDGVRQDHYTKDETDVKVDGLATDVYNRQETDAVFATQQALQEFRTEVGETYLDRDVLASEYATEARVDELRAYADATFATKAFAADHLVTKSAQAAFSDFLHAEAFFPRTEADERFAKEAALRDLETRVRADFYTRVDADAAFVSATRLDDDIDARLQAKLGVLEDTFYTRAAADDAFVDSAHLEGYTQAALDERLADLDAYSKSGSDARFASKALETAVRDEHYDRTACDQRFLSRAAFADFRARVPEQMCRVLAAPPPTDGTDRRTVAWTLDAALSDELSAVDAEGDALKHFFAVPTLLCSDAANSAGLTANVLSASADEVEVLVSNVRTDRTGWTAAGNPRVQIVLSITPADA